MKNAAGKAGIVKPVVALIQRAQSEALRTSAVERLEALVALCHSENQNTAASAGAVAALGEMIEGSARSSMRATIS